VTAHWGVADPAAATGSDAEKMLAFRAAFRALEHRIRIFADLPHASLERLKTRRDLERIGDDPPPADENRAG
jgi:arsenate reductase